MNKIIGIGFLVLLVIAAVLFVWNGGSLPSPLPQGSSSPTPTPTPSTSSGQADNMIRVSSPKPGEAIQSPVHIEGEARGNWYFEASFPGRVLDANGKILGLMPIQAQGDWMTTEFVPFKADLPFSTPATNTGFVVLQKDNPSGLPQNEDERRIPIKFGP